MRMIIKFSCAVPDVDQLILLVSISGNAEIGAHQAFVIEECIYKIELSIPIAE